MPSYLALINWTDQGLRTMKERDAAAEHELAKQAIAAVGGRMIFWYVLMGEYDIATLIELPDDESAARLMLMTGQTGNFRTKTMRAFTESEGLALIASLP